MKKIIMLGLIAALMFAVWIPVSGTGACSRRSFHFLVPCTKHGCRHFAMFLCYIYASRRDADNQCSDQPGS